MISSGTIDCKALHMLNHGKIKYYLGGQTNTTKYYKCIKQNINFFETMNISLSFIL